MFSIIPSISIFLVPLPMYSDFAMNSCVLCQSVKVLTIFSRSQCFKLFQGNKTHGQNLTFSNLEVSIIWENRKKKKKSYVHYYKIKNRGSYMKDSFMSCSIERYMCNISLLCFLFLQYLVFFLNSKQKDFRSLFILRLQTSLIFYLTQGLLIVGGEKMMYL